MSLLAYLGSSRSHFATATVAARRTFCGIRISASLRPALFYKCRRFGSGMTQADLLDCRIRADMKRLIRRFLWAFCRAGLVVGLAAIAVALGSGIYNLVFLCRIGSATGTIKSLAPVVNQGDGALNYLPVFTFTAQDGHSYTVTADVAANPPEFTVGQAVRVLYIRTDPAGAKLGSFWQLWFVTIVCAGLGLFFVGTGYLLLRYERRRQQPWGTAARESAVSSR